VSERNTGLSACVYLFVWAFIWKDGEEEKDEDDDDDDSK
jgi:hypothetical protein